MGLFDGKVFLELGTNVASVDIVQYAKSEGAYVIVTDYLPEEKSEAKKYADETYMISTLDTDLLVELIKAKRVDGVFCGVSEVNLKSVRLLAEKTGLPCYFTKEQWEICENKADFKELCNKFHVPTAKQYRLGAVPTREELDIIQYPVIVKPVDLCASRGIHICHNEKQLLEGYQDAYAQSPSHNVIVEQYIVGDEISATYTFLNGECRFSMLSQMYYNMEQKGLVPLPDAYIYPSKHLSAFLEKINEPMKKMLKSIGLKNGTIFVTGIATDNEFAFFEAGLRMAGTAPYNFVSYINGINIMELLTEYAINGKISKPELIEKENPQLNKKICCLYSLLNSGGKIGNISGVEKACRIPGVIHHTIQRDIGDEIQKDGTLGQVNVRFYIVKETINEIREVIEKIQQIVKITDINQKNMILKSHIIKMLNQ